MLRAKLGELEIGVAYDVGTFEMTRENMREFASRYDAQPFHLDDIAGAAHPLFTRMSASGWHTAVVMNKMLGDFYARTSFIGLAGGGVEQLRWLRPVYAGDTLSCSVEIVRARVSRSKPEIMFLSTRIEARNQAMDPVATMILEAVFETPAQHSIPAS